MRYERYSPKCPQAKTGFFSGGYHWKTRIHFSGQDLLKSQLPKLSVGANAADKKTLVAGQSAPTERVHTS